LRGDSAFRETAMTTKEKVMPKSEEEVREYSWPTKDALQDYTCPEGVKSRGSIRIAAGLVTDRVTIRTRWKQITDALRKII
jgi:hypothetical protein